jgi:hypothetical protein
MIIDCPYEIYDYIRLNSNTINLSYLKEKFYDLPFLDELEILSYKYLVCSEAAKKGYLHLLKYAYENGCPWNENTCSNAALNGHLDCLKYARENGCPWNEKTCSNAALNGHIDCLKYAHKNKCLWCQTTCSKAAKNGHLDCLKYAMENGSSTFEVCLNAAQNGHLDCLKYAHQNGCHWTTITTAYAAFEATSL